MIKGIGVDICQISRINLNLSKRILNELEYKKYSELKSSEKQKEYLAGRFSAKEAILKALTGLKKDVFIRDIAILNDDLGKPYVELPKFEDIKIWVSISHEKEYSIGQAIIENV